MEDEKSMYQGKLPGLKDKIIEKEIRVLKDELAKREKKRNSIYEALKYIKNKHFDCFMVSDIKIENQHMMIPLPTANIEWTFEVWDLVKDLVKRYKNCYPIHAVKAFKLDEKYQYVRFSN